MNKYRASPELRSSIISFIKKEETPGGRDMNFLYAMPGSEESSGVTGGFGVDWGRHSASDFKRMGVPSSIIKKTRPLFGVTGRKASLKAIDKLGKNPLTADEWNALNNAVLGGRVDSFLKSMGPAVGRYTPNLVKELASNYYRGAFTPKGSPKTWNYVQRGNLSDARDSWLDSGEYRESKSGMRAPGIASRYDRMHEAMRNEGADIARRARGGFIAPDPGRKLI